MKNLNVKNQNGRSMIEMLGVLAIIGILSVGGIAGYSKAMQKYRINKTIEQVTQTAANIQTFFTNQRNGSISGKYAGLNNNVIRKAKLAPDEMWNSDKSKLIHSFGGELFIGTSVKDSQGIIDSAFALQINGLDEEACITLATYDWRSMGNLIAVGIVKDLLLAFDEGINLDNCSGQNSDMLSFFCPNNTANPVPIPLDKAVQSCECIDDGYCAIGITMY